MIDPDTMELLAIPMPRQEAQPRRLMVTSDDKIFYVDYAERVPLDGSIPKPARRRSGRCQKDRALGPYGMAINDRRPPVVRRDGPRPQPASSASTRPRASSSAVTEIENGGGAVRHMFFHEPTREIWFGTDTNNIGRVEGSVTIYTQTGRANPPR